STRAQIGYPK
ncbi:hypothetical protein D030_4247B, partial [Vibrio parahaemolyticus AQ3810]